MKTLRFGIIGCGLMGREFAATLARWCQLVEAPGAPRLVAACSRTESAFGWFRTHFPEIGQYCTDYRELLRNPGVDAVYIAVPHHLHEEIYCAAIRAEKHLFGEKPFGIDLAANKTILECLGEHPNVFARCVSQFAFFPAAQRIGALLESGAFGRVIEAGAGLLHSSDLDPQKPLNWKRTLEMNGEYGCMGDLGMHACFLPFRAGWRPKNVRAILSNIIRERPDGKGGMAPCPTWDNATLLCEATSDQESNSFPMTFKFQRIAPGERNTWYFEVLGTKGSARFSTRNPRRLEWLNYQGGEQIWGDVQMGFETPFKTLTGPIFEFGMPDALLQMVAAFVYELLQGKPRSRFAGCVTPEEVALSHRLFTAALDSNERRSVSSL